MSYEFLIAGFSPIVIALIIVYYIGNYRLLLKSKNDRVHGEKIMTFVVFRTIILFASFAFPWVLQDSAVALLVVLVLYFPINFWFDYIIKRRYFRRNT